MRIPALITAPAPALVLVLVLALALALAALAPGAALAHAELAASSPAAGSAVKAPKAITLTFNEPVDPATAAASIIMTAMPGMANHGEMPIRNFTASWSGDGRTMTLALKQPLPTGSYDLRWQAAGKDGHLARGTVAFDVK